jgi:hypothetical protein
MVSTLEWVLAGVGVYWLAVIWARRTGLLPAYIGTQGPILTLHTKRFRALLDRLAAPRRFWRAWGNLGVGLTFVVMAGTFLFLVVAARATLQNPVAPSAVNRPRNVLVIPGVNDFLPLSVAPEIVFGLLVGLVVHEGGHGLLCRVGHIDIKSMGLALFAFVPIGAFVEPDEDSRRRADRGAQARMFAAGVMNNFVVTAVAFALLFGPVAVAIAVAPGAAVAVVLLGSVAAVAVIDHLNDGLSAVYTFFDPDESARGLGNYAILWQIDEARRLGLSWIYLGYWIQECKKMAYKARFYPHEVFWGGRWQPVAGAQS